MSHLRAFVLTGLLALLATAQATAVEPIRFARTPDISPDGKLVAFSYLGDIYTVEAIGGVARPVTSHPAHDINPVFSPDGRHIAFTSNRHGGYDVFVVPSRGGRPTRLTFDSAPDMACGWSPDGKNVLFASLRGVDYPGGYELYTVAAAGGRVSRVSPAEGKEGVFSPKGDKIAYTRGPGSWYRKGYRGSSNDDIWLMNADGSNNQRVTTFNGQDHSPMWASDGGLFLVSEEFGTANIVHRALTTGAKARQHTQHKGEAVRRARVSKNGETIVYECGADLWVVGTASGSTPRKLAIEVNADEKSNNEQIITFTRNITEFAPSSDEKFFAFVVHGKIFRVPVSSTPGRPEQLTSGPSNDHGIAWAKDSSRMLFLSDRDGQEDLYLLEPDDPDHPKFTEAHNFKVTRLTNTREAESGVSFSPDGKKVAFLRSGKLFTMSAEGKELGKDLKEVVKDVQVFDYEWSPDSKWIAYARRDGSFANDVYITPATGATVADPVRNVTRYATFNAGITWSANGKKLAFLSERRNSGSLHVLDLEKPTTGTSSSSGFGFSFGSKPLAIDWDDIHRRVKAVTASQVDEAAISPDGSKVIYRDLTTRDLWVASTTGGSLTRLTTGGITPRQIIWSKRRALVGSSMEVVYFLDRFGQIRLCNAGGGEAKAGVDKAPPFPIKVRMAVRRDELFQEMFDQGWRYLADNFYDDKFHGTNWDDVRARYRPLVKNITMKEDLYALMYLMMGELNASHLGVSGFMSSPEEDTPELGLIFDQAHRGKGLKVAEVLKRGPADKKGLRLKAGDYIVALEGVELDDKANLAKLLNGKLGDKIVAQVADSPDAPAAKRRRVELETISRTRTGRDRPGASDLMYERWVAKNAEQVSKLSGGKLGYVHIPSMDETGMEEFVRSFYSDNYEKDAIVLDVRFNSGGYTHDQVLNYLGSKGHTRFKHRHGGQGWVLRSGDRKWDKPLVLLINNRSYSDAEIFPSAFRTLKLGKLVGEPTGGFVIGTSAVRLIDGSQFRIPRIGVYTTEGVNMDREGVKPDIEVVPHPDQLAKGRDEQLEKAVEVLRTDVIAWKKKKAEGVVSAPGTGGKPVVKPEGKPDVKPVVTPPGGK